MRRPALACHALLLVAALTVGAATWAPGAAAEATMNLEVLPKTLTKAEVKAIMKTWTKALGVKCQHCHDLGAGMAKDTPHKEDARRMVRMVDEINSKHLSHGKVSCVTCHRGAAEPPK